MAALALVGAFHSAWADSEGTCERLAAEADAESAVLYAPRLVVEGARAPSVVDTADPVARTGGLQARAAIAFSGIDALRGRALERIASAECQRERAQTRAIRVLGAGRQVGELAAARAEIAYREAHAGEIDALLADASARFAAQRATAHDVADLRARRSAMQLRIDELRGAAAMLEALDMDVPTTTSLAELARASSDSELAADRERASLRSLSAWRVDMRAGVAAGDQADWFAVLEVGYSLGQPWQKSANRRALAARERANASERNALPVRLAQLGRAMRASVDATTAQLTTLDGEIATLTSERERIAAHASDPAKQLAARYTLELIELEARRSGLAALLAARRPLAGDAR